MKNHFDLRKSALALTLAAVVSLAVPAPAAALGGEESLWGGVWGWLTGLWTDAVATLQDQGAGLDPNG